MLNVQSFPLMSDLPTFSTSLDWNWEKFSPPFESKEFWLGTDPDGGVWLTKLQGSFSAYREIVFARLAQKMHWSCQSSIFLKIDQKSATILGVDPNTTHAAHWYMPEHKSGLCGEECPLDFLSRVQINTVDDLKGSEISSLLDWPKSEYAAYLFGAHERSEKLYTTDHELVIIDSERMFATKPVPLDMVCWWSDNDGEPSESGKALATEVCGNFASLSRRDIRDALDIPNGASIHESWPIEPILWESRKAAKSFLGK